MRLLFLVITALMSSSSAFASGSGFEGTYNIEQITQTTGTWKGFWIRPNVQELQEILIEEIGNQLYIGLKDSHGLTWSANYGVCTGAPQEYCNATKSADGQTLELKFWGDWSWFVITLGPQDGRLVWKTDEASASMTFVHSKK